MFAVTASVIITTCNRPEMLTACVRDVLAQESVAEIIVVDDSPERSARGALATVGGPVRYIPTAGGVGPSAARNLGAREARNDCLVHFDDDCRVEPRGTVTQALRDLEPTSVAAVAMPYRNVCISGDILCRSARPDRLESVYAFTACAYAIKKSLFESVGGYREEFFYMGEESDLCIRLLNRGFTTRLGTGPAVDHLQPAGRISKAADYYGRRNDVLFEALNAPATKVLPAMLRATVKSLVYGFRVGRPLIMLKGSIAGWAMAGRMLRQREPVRLEVYDQFKRAVSANNQLKGVPA